MLKVLRKFKNEEKGQAFAEYFVLIPGSILMVLAGYSLIAGTVKGAYCDVVNVFSSGICQSAEVIEGDQGQGHDESAGNPEEDGDEDFGIGNPGPRGHSLAESGDQGFDTGRVHAERDRSLAAVIVDLQAGAVEQLPQGYIL